MEYTIQFLAKMAGVTTRTLRYYDEVGLLKPCRINSSGYRIYGAREVDLLQQILLFKEMGFELSTIRQMLDNPDFDRLKALKEHMITLAERKHQLEALMNMVQKTIDMEEGDITMTDAEKFEGLKKSLIDENETKYGSQIRDQYGEKTVAESNQKMLNLTRKEYDQMEKTGLEIIRRLEQAVAGDIAPESEEGQAIAALHKDWLTYSWSAYSKEAHAGLAQMYVDDPRFTKYYDKQVDGCAAFLRDAVLIFTR